MTLFMITTQHPESGEAIIEYKEFNDSPDEGITAQEWAEDYAYNKANKEGPYEVKEVK